MARPVKLIIILMLAAWLAAPSLSLAAVGDYGLDKAAGVANLPRGGTPSTKLATEAGRIIGTLLAFLGIIFLVLMIVGGLMWMTAAGNESKIEKARALLIAAVIGLLIVAAAYAITSFIADNVLAT